VIKPKGGTENVSPLQNQAARLLAGMHDVEAFVRTIAFPGNRYVTERSLKLELIEQIEHTKGGREAALQFLWGRGRLTES